MLDFTPDPILVTVGSVPIYWYGICYALGLVVTYLVASREASRKGLDVDLVPNGIIVIAVAALIGGRLYHVIDRWDLYQDNLIGIVLPPYTGLGVFGGLITGTVAAILYARWKRQSVWAWADVVAPALFAMQAVGRWGNYFNQELYGPPTDLPWGIPIECQYRVAAYPCSEFPFETTRFQPLFLYESLSALVGMLVLLWLARRASGRLRQGDLLGVFFVWYGIVRFALEGLRTDNWTFNGIPTAWLFAAGFIGFGLLIIASRHLRPGPSMAEEDARRLAERSAAGGGEPPAGSPDVPATDGTAESPAGDPTTSDGEPASIDPDDETADAPATDPQAGSAGAT